MKKLKMCFTAIFITVMMLALCSPVAVSANEIKIKIIVGNKEFIATMYNNESVQAFVSQLPMTLDMSELNGNEKYYYLPGSLPTNSEKPGQINAGDIMLYGNNCLVLFYKTFSSSYSYTNLGKIEDVTGLVAALGNGSIQVAFETITGKVEGEPLNIKNIVKETNRRKVNVEFCNPNDVAVSGTRLAAIYDGGKMVEVKMLNEMFPSKESNITVNFNSEVKEHYNIKAFVWQLIGGMQPISNALEI